MNYSVAELCQQKSLALRELAERAGLEECRVAAIALGRWTPSPAERQKIAAVLDLATIAILISGLYLWLPRKGKTV